MYEHDKTEYAYKRGYEAGVKDFAKGLHDVFISKVQKYYCKVKDEHSYKFLEGYLVDDVLSNIDNLVKEMEQ
jgi:hypothetical protein